MATTGFTSTPDKCHHDWRFANLSAMGGIPIEGDPTKRIAGVWYCTKCRLMEPASALKWSPQP